MGGHIVQGGDGFAKDVSDFIITTCLAHVGQIPLPVRPAHQDCLVAELIHTSRGRACPPGQDAATAGFLGDTSHLEHNVSIMPATGN